MDYTTQIFIYLNKIPAKYAIHLKFNCISHINKEWILGTSSLHNNLTTVTGQRKTQHNYISQLWGTLTQQPWTNVT